MEFRMKQKMFLLVSSLVVAFSAASECQADLEPMCHSVTASQSSTVGMRCQTSKGVIFERVAIAPGVLGWKDLRTQVIWGQTLVGTYNNENQNASIVCAGEHQGQLPTIAQYSVAEDHGFYELREEGVRVQDYWVSDVSPYRHNLGFSYYQANGTFERAHLNDELSVRCVYQQR